MSLQPSQLNKLLVENILRHPHEFDWSVQGLGMMRCYLSKEVRLHIWHSDLRMEGASVIHTHPWDFTSHVIAGQINNTILIESDDNGIPHKRQKLHCGVGGGLIGSPQEVNLAVVYKRTYHEGEWYVESAEQIHLSQALNGTVTIIERRFKEDEEHAYVYWETGEWGTAEPREAEPFEIENVTQYSLARWFSALESKRILGNVV